MAEPVKTFEAEALSLPDKDRARLARVLLLSLDAVEDEGDEVVWAEEAERRYREIETGAVEPISSAEVLREARARLR